MYGSGTAHLIGTHLLAATHEAFEQAEGLATLGLQLPWLDDGRKIAGALK